MSNSIIKSTTTTGTQGTKRVEFSVDNSIRDCVVVKPTNLPTSLEDVENYIRLSDNGKNLPIGEATLKFTVNVEGVDVEFSGKFACWFGKKDLDNVKKAIQEKAKAKAEAELVEKKAMALSSLTPEQLQALIDLGLLK